MNKLGFYIENTTVNFLRSALRQVKPPTILIHAQDRGLLREIRRDLSPNSFVIGRLFKDNAQQDAWLDSGDPERYGREFAEEIIHYDFELATEKGAGDRLLIDAWMSLNEAIRGPASFPGYAVDDQFRRRAEAYDRFQDAFRQRLAAEGLQAVAFNFAAGNFTKPEHYLDWFPRTLASYTYLGFHEYGWPGLKPGPGVATAALFYRTCMTGIRQQYGGGHRAIITELGLTMAYGHPGNPDHGWLNSAQPLNQDEYWNALNWYNSEILKDDYVMGGCLFQVGHAGRWVTFRHLGEDASGQAILLINRIEGLASGVTPPPPPKEPPQPPPPGDLSLTERVDKLISDATSAAAVAGGLPAKADAVEGRLTPLAPQAQEGLAAAAGASNLRTRLAQVQAALDDLEVDPPPEGWAAAKERATVLSGKLNDLQPQVDLTGSASTRVRDIQQAFPAQSQEAQIAVSLQADLQRILDEAQTLRVSIPQ